MFDMVDYVNGLIKRASHRETPQHDYIYCTKCGDEIQGYKWLSDDLKHHLCDECYWKEQESA